MSAYVQPQIKHLVMGGTIDSQITRSGDTVITLSSHVQEYIQTSVQPYFGIKSQIIALKDSRDLDERDYANMIEAIKQSPSNLIFVTIGTFKMCHAAELLTQEPESGNYQIKPEFDGRTIVFTGSFWPLNQVIGSDAAFNLGWAIASLLNLPPGVYVSMHGRNFPVGSLCKDTVLYRFVTK